MPKLIIIDSAEKARVLDAAVGLSLMTIMSNGGVDELPALCGGACACATCHVWVDASFNGELPPMSEQESDLLECAANRRANSRLSCQLTMTEALDGMRVTVVPT